MSLFAQGASLLMTPKATHPKPAPLRRSTTLSTWRSRSHHKILELIKILGLRANLTTTFYSDIGAPLSTAHHNAQHNPTPAAHRFPVGWTYKRVAQGLVCVGHKLCLLASWRDRGARRVRAGKQGSFFVCCCGAAGESRTKERQPEHWKRSSPVAGC